MRTTLTIDDDLAAQLEELRRREGLSLRAAVNELLREGIRQRMQPPRAKSYQMETRRLGLKAGIDPTKLNQLVDELEAEGILSVDND